MNRVDTYKLNHAVDYRERTGDRNFCTLLALHCVTGISLDLCHKHMSRFGRKFKKGMLKPEIVSSLENTSKFYFKKGEYSNTNRITLKRFIENHPKGRYYVLVRGHAFAIIDGVVYDYCDKPRRQITEAWRCYTKKEIDNLRG